MNNYHSIQVIKAFVKSDLLLDSYSEDHLNCEIIGISIYKGEALTFVIKLEDGEVFSYIPPHKIFWQKNIESFTLSDLVYVNSPSSKAAISVLSELKTTKISCYFKRTDTWVQGKYLYTLDFLEDNELLNLVKLDNGFFAFLPFHKIKFKPLIEIKKEFKPYKKQRNTYIV